jgi:hypothetical protein
LRREIFWLLFPFIHDLGIDDVAALLPGLAGASGGLTRAASTAA